MRPQFRLASPTKGLIFCGCPKDAGWGGAQHMRPPAIILSNLFMRSRQNECERRQAIQQLTQERSHFVSIKILCDLSLVAKQYLGKTLNYVYSL